MPDLVRSSPSLGPVVAELQHVRKVYGQGDTAVAALDDLCMTVQRGD
jgi:putative ABC transport system ATP-binding protein